MKFPDPAAILELELPHGWALDPMSSSMFQRVFTQWGEGQPRHLFVHLDHSPTHGTHEDWIRARQALLPDEAVASEVTFGAGPVLWVVRPGREGRPDQRWAIARGRVGDFTLEEVGVPPGGT